MAIEENKISAFTVINSIVNDKRLSKEDQLEIFLRIAAESIKQATYSNIMSDSLSSEKEEPVNDCCPSCRKNLFLKKDAGESVYLCKSCDAIFKEYIDPKSERKLFTTTEIINKLLERVSNLENELYRKRQFEGKD